MDHTSKWLFTSFIIVLFFACTISQPPPPTSSQDQASTGLLDPDNPNKLYDPNEPDNLINDPNTLDNPEGPGEQTGSIGERFLDFPYELIPDSLTAVTCPETQILSGKYFTLVAGVHSAHGGLRLSTDFLRNNNITERTPYQKVRQLLDRSPFLRARARLALHDESTLAILEDDKERLIQGFFPILNNPTTLDHLSRLNSVSTTRSLSHFQANSGGSFVTSLPIPGKILTHLAPELAEQTYGETILALTYTLDGRNSIYNSNRLPYGRGYKLHFEDPYHMTYMLNVQEENLVETRKEGEWFCPRELRLMIHRARTREQSHFNRDHERYNIPEGIIEEGFCYTGEKRQQGPNPAEAYFFEKMFGTSDLNRLPFELGKTVVIRRNGPVIIDQPCIKFRRSGCYPGQDFYRIEFDPEKLNECEQIRYMNNDNRYRICPAFLSVCYRRAD